MFVLIRAQGFTDDLLLSRARESSAARVPSRGSGTVATLRLRRVQRHAYISMLWSFCFSALLPVPSSCSFCTFSSFVVLSIQCPSICGISRYGGFCCFSYVLWCFWVSCSVVLGVCGVSVDVRALATIRCRCMLGNGRVERGLALR